MNTCFNSLANAIKKIKRKRENSHPGSYFVEPGINNQESENEKEPGVENEKEPDIENEKDQENEKEPDIENEKDQENEKEDMIFIEKSLTSNEKEPDIENEKDQENEKDPDVENEKEPDIENEKDQENEKEDMIFIEKSLTSTYSPDHPPKRYKNAYIFFTINARKEYKETLENLSFKDRDKWLGDKWRSMEDNEKSKYQNQSDDDKKRYKSQMEMFSNN